MQLRQVLRQGSDGGQDQGRRTTEEDGRGQRLIPSFGHRVVEAATLSDLPVHAGRARVVDLQAVHAQVGRASSLGVLGVDEGQGYEGTTVLAPAGQDWQPVEPHVARPDFGDRSRAHPPGTDTQERQKSVARAPQLADARGQEVLGQGHEPAHERQRLFPKSHLRAPGRAEEVGAQGDLRPAHIGEEKGRAARRDHAAVDLRRLEVFVDGSVHHHEVAVALETVEEGAEVGEEGLAQAVSAPDSVATD